MLQFQSRHYVIALGADWLKITMDHAIGFDWLTRRGLAWSVHVHARRGPNVLTACVKTELTLLVTWLHFAARLCFITNTCELTLGKEGFTNEMKYIMFHDSPRGLHLLCVYRS